MKKADMAVRIAKTVAITAGICSSDEDDEFDSRAFADGFAGKMKKKVGEYIDGIHSGDAMNGEVRVPYVFFPENYSGEFTDGKYTGKFELSYNPNCEDDGFQFCVGASLCIDGDQHNEILWSDKSCYTMHVKSFSGEHAVLNKNVNAFTIGNIGDYSIMTLLNGEGVIDEYGVDKADEEKKDEIAKANYEFLSDEFKKIADGIKKKIAGWLEDSKVVGSICCDIGDEVSQHERDRKESQQ